MADSPLNMEGLQTILDMGKTLFSGKGREFAAEALGQASAYLKKNTEQPEAKNAGVNEWKRSPFEENDDFYNQLLLKIKQFGGDAGWDIAYKTGVLYRQPCVFCVMAATKTEVIVEVEHKEEVEEDLGLGDFVVKLKEKADNEPAAKVVQKPFVQHHLEFITSKLSPLDVTERLQFSGDPEIAEAVSFSNLKKNLKCPEYKIAGWQGEEQDKKSPRGIYALLIIRNPDAPKHID